MQLAVVLLSLLLTSKAIRFKGRNCTNPVNIQVNSLLPLNAKQESSPVSIVQIGDKKINSTQCELQRSSLTFLCAHMSFHKSMDFKAMIDDQETKLIGEIDTIFLQTQQADNPIQHLESALNNLKINLSNSFSDIRETTVAKINTNEITFTPEKRFLYNENGIGMSILQQKIK